ncbi:G-type lectin S-receptor-like serine/threonine-protein kinase At4g27290 [Prunus dulcis]|uniref:G-type lectin S-receptor-like serine/threonine-protein kinase At4g27290 n=1 Tax=Prunus dulcis TaxID=3755 RepID=UPI0014830CDE|nr:G-type lectin S-receptor-like serine/threonine-protein kinase At4g27290 [Prunus dulcis]
MATWTRNSDLTHFDMDADEFACKQKEGNNLNGRLIQKSKIAADTISAAQSITSTNTLVSSGQSFELGIFSAVNSEAWYLGIWYKNFPNIVVWVANRENPVADSHGSLKLSKNGSLVLLDQMNNTIWSSTSSQVAEDPVAQLLENGNLVVREKATTDSESYIWESFNLPSDTLLPEMKLGWNFRTGLNRFLTSWKNASDPSPGEYTYGVDNVLLPQLVIAKGSKKMFRTGPWNGLWFTGTPGLVATYRSVVKPIFVYNTNEFYYSYESFNSSTITRLKLSESGLIQRLVVTEGIVCRMMSVIVMESLEQMAFAELVNHPFVSACMVIINGGSSCLMWFGDLVDLREFVEEDSQQDIYIRLPHSELGKTGRKDKRVVIILVISAVSSFLFLASRGTKEDLELPLFDFDTIAAATNNFSYTNKLGEGGFGPVYKARLTREEFIAVKRHSKDSGHGIKEFKNEVAMIANLQHWNIVKLLGCCIQGEERMLIYEYMPNKSLDCFIFGEEN